MIGLDALMEKSVPSAEDFLGIELDEYKNVEPAKLSRYLKSVWDTYVVKSCDNYVSVSEKSTASPQQTKLTSPPVSGGPPAPSKQAPAPPAVGPPPAPSKQAPAPPAVGPPSAPGGSVPAPSEQAPAPPAQGPPPAPGGSVPAPSEQAPAPPGKGLLPAPVGSGPLAPVIKKEYEFDADRYNKFIQGFKYPMIEQVEKSGSGGECGYFVTAPGTAGNIKELSYSVDTLLNTQDQKNDLIEELKKLGQPTKKQCGEGFVCYARNNMAGKCSKKKVGQRKSGSKSSHASKNVKISSLKPEEVKKKIVTLINAQIGPYDQLEDNLSNLDQIDSLSKKIKDLSGLEEEQREIEKKIKGYQNIPEGEFDPGLIKEWVEVESEALKKLESQYEAQRKNIPVENIDCFETFWEDKNYKLFLEAFKKSNQEYFSSKPYELLANAVLLLTYQKLEGEDCTVTDDVKAMFPLKENIVVQKKTTVSDSRLIETALKKKYANVNLG